jgi:hypothetical protein
MHAVRSDAARWLLDTWLSREPQRLSLPGWSTRWTLRAPGSILLSTAAWRTP